MSTISELRERVLRLRNKSNNSFETSELGLISDILESIEAGDIGGGGGGVTAIPNDTEFDTGKTLNGATVYGYRASSNTITSGSISQLVLDPVSEILLASASALNGFFSLSGSIDVFLNSNVITIKNNTGSDADVVAYIEYTKV